MKENNTPAIPAASKPCAIPIPRDGIPRYRPLLPYIMNGLIRIPRIAIRRTDFVLYQIPNITKTNAIPNNTVAGVTCVYPDNRLSDIAEGANLLLVTLVSNSLNVVVGIGVIKGIDTVCSAPHPEESQG